MPSSDEIDRAFNELLEEPNDRAVAIVGATLVENMLEEAIVRRLIPMSKAHRDALFRNEQSYTFAAKIDLGFSLGLYGNKAKTDLHRIKKVRNEFAHNLDRNFSHPLVAKTCKEMTDYNPVEPLDPDFVVKLGDLGPYVLSREWRWRFLHAVSKIGLGLMKETLIPVLPPSPTVLKD